MVTSTGCFYFEKRSFLQCRQLIVQNVLHDILFCMTKHLHYYSHFIFTQDIFAREFAYMHDRVIFLVALCRIEALSSLSPVFFLTEPQNKLLQLTLTKSITYVNLLNL